MRKSQSVRWILAVIAALLSCGVLLAQESGCVELHAMVGMANAKSTKAMMTLRQKAGDGYRLKVVFAFRLFELHPTDVSAASAVLDLIPQNDEQDIVLHSLSYGLECDTRSEEDGHVLAVLGAGLPRDLARAILLVPDKMSAYVSYAFTSAPDPNSDYALQMETVCRAKHREFVKAVDELPPDARSGFLRSIFNPDGCHALRLPEQ